MVEALHTILTTDGVQVTVQDSDSDTGPARSSWSDIAGPLVGLRVVPINKCISLFD